MKIKNFMKYFKEGGLEIFQNFYEIFKYFKVKYFIVRPYPRYINVTDGQKDGRTTYDSNTALALRASRGNKNWKKPRISA